MLREVYKNLQTDITDMQNRGYILVVEDDYAIADFLNDVLSEEGYAAVVVDNSSEAIAALEVRPPDLVLLDTHVLKLEGTQLLVRLGHRRYRHIPLIMMADSADEASSIMEKHNIPCLPKPFELDELLGYVESSLDRKRKRRRW